MKKSAVPVKFISTVPGLSGIKDLAPKPSKEFIPQWFKDMPYGRMEPGSKHVYEEKTAKMCPALPETFSQGYVVPMWVDTIIKFDESTNSWIWRTANHNTFKLDIHPPEQLLNHVSEGVTYQGSTTSFIFKAMCPWRLITPPGYSTLQLPLFYHFKKEFSVLPGVIRTDIHHELNQQVLYHGGGKEVFIRRGEPFVQYIPYKRLQTDLLVSDMTVEEGNLFKTNDLDSFTSFDRNYLRKKRQQDNYSIEP
jgi:hypothetical protein